MFTELNKIWMYLEMIQNIHEYTADFFSHGQIAEDFTMSVNKNGRFDILCICLIFKILWCINI